MENKNSKIKQENYETTSISGKCHKRSNGLHLECWDETKDNGRLVCLMCDKVLTK